MLLGLALSFLPYALRRSNLRLSRFFSVWSLTALMWPSYYAEPALVKVSWRKIPITLIDVRTQAVIGGCIYCRKGKRARRCESPVPPLNDKVPGCDPTVLC